MNLRSNLLFLACIVILSCNHKNWNIDDDYVKLNAQLNNPAETIHVGDTLKFKLAVPDTVITSLNEKIAVTSMQRSFYSFHLARFDSATKTYTTIWGNTFVTDGGTLESGGGVYLSTGSKPFKATLNLIPPTKGVYYLQVDRQPGALRINQSYNGGLLVNFAIADKHWTLIDPYIPDYSTGASIDDAKGYGTYCFKVN